MGCLNQDCQLCKNNPHKTCQAGVDFDEAYADNQVLKARCDAEVYIELINQLTGEVFSAPGVEVQVRAEVWQHSMCTTLLLVAGNLLCI